MTIGEQIRNLRREKGITQRQLAKAINFSSSYIGDLESNRTNPSIKTLEIIAIYFHVEMAYFFQGECCYDKMLKGSTACQYKNNDKCKKCPLNT